MPKLQAQNVTDCSVGGHTRANVSLASSGTGAVNLLTGLLPMAIIQGSEQACMACAEAHVGIASLLQYPC